MLLYKISNISKRFTNAMILSWIDDWIQHRKINIKFKTSFMLTAPDYLPTFLMARIGELLGNWITEHQVRTADAV